MRLACSDSIYRNLKRLETWGFVTAVRSHGQPAYYFAVPIERALTSYQLYLRHLLDALIEEQFKEMAKRGYRKS